MPRETSPLVPDREPVRERQGATLGVSQAAPWAALVVAWAILILFWGPSVLTLTVDDSFYYLVTARHAAEGLGFSFDGIHPTNGFHPLWMWVLVPVARLAPGDVAVLTRAVLMLQLTVLAVATAALVRALTPHPTQRTPLPAVALLSGFYVVKVLANGMESALAYALLVALLLAVSRAERAGRTASAKDLLVVAALAAGLTLARLTSVVFAAPAVWAVARRLDGRRQVVLAAAAIFVLPLAAYGAGNLVSSGHWLPVSAAIKASREAGTLAVRLGALVPSMSLFAVVLAWRARRATLLRSRGLSDALWVLAGGTAALGAVDALVRGVAVPEIWTLVPQATLLLACVTVESELLESAPARAVLLGALLLADVGQWLARLDPASYAPYTEARLAGLWLAEHAAKEGIAAGWDSGVTAAYASRRFIDLDGLSNSWDFKTRVLDRGDSAVDAYLDENGVDFVAQSFDVAALPSLGERSWGRWPVVFARCYEFRPVFFRPARAMAELVFARPGRGSGLEAASGWPCTPPR